MSNFSLESIQSALTESQIDGWLLYDFRGSNPLAKTVAQIPLSQMGSRRWCYFVPAIGTPLKIVHRIEDTVLDHLPGDKKVYLKWQEFESALHTVCHGCKKIAMEYAPFGRNPYISRVDAGTVELVRSFGPEVVSSGDLIQKFEATWTDTQWSQHLKAAEITNSAFDVAWKFIADAIKTGQEITERSVEQRIMEHFSQSGAKTYHPPIVARNEHSGLPHYETGSGQKTIIQTGDFVLIDLWAKLDEPESVYSDLTRVGFVGESVPDRYQQVFSIVASARDAAISFLKRELPSGRTVKGGEVDQVVRGVIEKAGYGEFFSHRTGHNIGQEVHGNGAHIDHLETCDDRVLLPKSCFSIEPGIYLADFGVRSEVNIYLDEKSEVHVTGGKLQTEVLPILRDF